MSTPDEVGEGTVSGNQVSIPAHIRRRLDIEDGDVIRWKVVHGDLVAEVQDTGEGAFEGFEPGASEEPVDSVETHDGFGTE